MSPLCFRLKNQEHFAPEEPLGKVDSGSTRSFHQRSHRKETMNPYPMTLAALVLTTTSCVTRKYHQTATTQNTNFDTTQVLGVSDFYLCKGVPSGRSADPFPLLSLPLALKGEFLPHSISTAENAQALPSPLKAIAFQNRKTGEWTTAHLASEARIEATPWMDASGGPEQSRWIAVRNAFETGAGLKGELFWEVWQSRSTSAPYRLITKDAEVISVSLNLNGFSASYSLMSKNSIPCDQDAYQGEQPGTLFGGGIIAGNDRTPRRITIAFTPLDGKIKTLRVEGRTSIGGFDKTMQMTVDSFLVSGVLNSEIIVKIPGNALHSPSHHNWGDSYLVDIEAAALNASDLKLLRERKIRYLHIRRAEKDETRQFPQETKLRALEGLDETLNNKQLITLVREETWQF